MDPTNPGEGVLANFFNSLLHKKIGSPRGAGKLYFLLLVSFRSTSGLKFKLEETPDTKNSIPGDLSSLSNTSSSPSSLRTDAAAELDKLAARKSLATSTPTKDSSSQLNRTPSQDQQNSFSEC